MSSDQSYDYDLVAPCSPSATLSFAAACAHAVICLLGLLGNGLVVTTYALYRRTKTMTDVFLLNVALADLLLVLLLPLLVYGETSSWHHVTCKLVRGGYSASLFGGTMLLAAVSVDRFIAVVLVRRGAALRSGRRGLLVCAGAWTAALLLSVPTFVFSQRYVPSHAVDDPRLVCDLLFQDEAVARRTKVALPAVQLTAGFFLPLLVISLSYGAVVLTLQRSRSVRRHRALWVVLAVVCTFVLCHLPYNVVLLQDLVRQPDASGCQVQVVRTLTRTLAYFHCCLNPLVYAFMGVRFRGHFREIMLDLWNRTRTCTKTRPSRGRTGVCSQTASSLVM